MRSKRPAELAGDAGEIEVLLDRQPGDDAPVFRHQLHAVQRRL